MQYSPPRSSPVPIADTPVCNNIDDSILDIPLVSIVDTSARSNNNSSIQELPSPLSDTVVSLQQTPVTLKLVLFRFVFTIYCNKGVSFKRNLAKGSIH